MDGRTFGISTRLFHDARLTRDHLVHVAAHDFEAIELYVTPEHFDVHDPAAVDQLAEWLSDTRLVLHSVHAHAAASLDDLQATIAICATIPFRFLVMHRPAASTERVLGAVTEAAGAAGIEVALEVLNDRHSNAHALVALLEEDLDELPLGICLDIGHAHLGGDLSEALETVSGHLLTTHVHDNGGRQDDHLIPYSGGIAWETTIMELQKVGYDGALMFELAPGGDPAQVLSRAARARTRLEKAFVTF
jgi:sugar phosphate isomerase/epimerase